MKTFDHLAVIGLHEWIALPELGVVCLRAKTDTGAGTSTLHASEIIPFERDGKSWIRFTAHLGCEEDARHEREAPVVAKRTIRSSTGHTQIRYVIRTQLALGDRCWPVEFTLTCRKSMRYRALLGARALIDGHLVVNPACDHVQGRPKQINPITITGV